MCGDDAGSGPADVLECEARPALLVFCMIDGSERSCWTQIDAHSLSFPS